MTSPIKFDRTPYKVTYYKDGAKHVINRRPPPKLHDSLPTDIVQLKHKKNDDYLEGDKFTVKGINPRHANVLHVEDEDGNATFLNAHDTDLIEKVYPRDGEDPNTDPIDRPSQNEYLLWP